MQNFNLIKWVAEWARQIKDDFYVSEKTESSIIKMLLGQQMNYEVCLRCGRYSKVDLCKRCDY